MNVKNEKNYSIYRSAQNEMFHYRTSKRIVVD